MYKSDKDRIEDVVFSLVFIELMITHCRKNNTPHAFDDAFKLLIPEIEEALDHKRLAGRVTLIRDKVCNYCYKNKFTTRKGFMALSSLAAGFHDCEVRELLPGLKTIVKVMNDTFVAGYDMEPGLKMADASAINHTPKILKVLHQYGYFEDVEFEGFV